eukprot:6206979-Pleurochrysis_carterae.AAC.2
MLDVFIASHAYLRSAPAPLSKFLNTVLAMAAVDLEPPSSTHRVGAPQPVCLLLLPAPDGVYLFIIDIVPFSSPGW